MRDNPKYVVYLSSMEMEAAARPVADYGQARKAASDCSGRMCQVEKDSEEVVRLAPPQLFNLAALQAEAHRLFGYSAGQTRGLALSLYGKGLLTDPETDSRYLPVELGYPTEKLIRLLAKELPFLDGALPEMEVRQMFGPDDETVGRHAILPVLTPGGWDKSGLDGPEQNLLCLIGARVIMAASGAHIHEDHKSRLTCNHHPFFLECRHTRQEGYRETEIRMENFFGIRQEGTIQKEAWVYLGKVFGPCNTRIEQKVETETSF